jgi:protein-S-isoprenylcysteine O-methyltransferase Ste14
MKIETDSAQVKLPPPFMLLAAMAGGMLLQFLFPVVLDLGSLRWALGLPVAVAAFVVIVYCNGVFAREGTNIAPWKPTSKLMTAGIYGHSRNPIYASFVLFCVGLGLAEGNAWMFVTAALLALGLRFAVIAKEERYLEEKFGEDYRAYKASVRRWL